MATDLRILVGRRIRELRKSRRWRQVDLAAHSGLNEIYICDLERGEKEVCLFTIQRLAKSFDMKIYEFFSGIDA